MFTSQFVAAFGVNQPHTKHRILIAVTHTESATRSVPLGKPRPPNYNRRDTWTPDVSHCMRLPSTKKPGGTFGRYLEEPDPSSTAEAVISNQEADPNVLYRAPCFGPSKTLAINACRFWASINPTQIPHIQTSKEKWEFKLPHPTPAGSASQRTKTGVCAIEGGV